MKTKIKRSYVLIVVSVIIVVGGISLFVKKPDTATNSPLGSSLGLESSTYVLESITRAGEAGEQIPVPIRQLEKFTLMFAPDGNVGIGTDCNSAGASYTASATGSLSFGPMMMTMMYCEGSDESTYVQILERAETFRIGGSALTIGAQNGYYTLTYRLEE